MSLKKVAASMHVEAKARGKSARTLSRGLRLILFYRRDDIVLALSRAKVLPSEKEVEICQTNFFFGYPLTNKANKGNTVYIAIAKDSIYGKAA
jgi:hypothetical protein